MAVMQWQDHRYQKNGLFSVRYYATCLAFFLSFLLRPLTVLIRQTRQAVYAINSLSFLDVYGKDLGILKGEGGKMHCIRFGMCPLLAPHFLGFFLSSFAAATISSNQTNKAGGTCN